MWLSQIIGDRSDIRLVYLGGPRELIAERLATRRAHFMPPTLLDSQFATLEPPRPDENPITVGINLSSEQIVSSIGGVLLSPEAPGNPVRPNCEGTS